MKKAQSKNLIVYPGLYIHQSSLCKVYLKPLEPNLFSRKAKGGQVYTFQWSHLCLRNSLQIATRICQFSQQLGTKLDMPNELK